MGKFSGVLIASDYDNTMVYTEGALKSGGPLPSVSRENREAVEYFMAEGGTFSVATGRALPSFSRVREGVPMNGPTVLFRRRCHLRLRSAALPIHGLSAGVRPGAYLPPAGGPAGDGAGDLSRR